MNPARHIRLALIGAVALSSTLAGLSAAEQAPTRWGDWPAWGDQKDGTYRNPVLPGDYSDLDCIRVGDDYYAISSTFQYSPGMIVLRSRDLVNWRIIGHVVADVTQIGPDMNWDRMNRQGKGIWAGAIRHHAGKFWVYFGTADEGYFMSSAKDPAGPWEPLHRMTTEAGWDDCCPFWDDDGQGYFVGTHFKGGYKTWLYKLTPDGRDLIPESRVLINEGSRREASKLYKINGTYYHFFSEHQPNIGRYVMMQRAGKVTGPYTGRRQLSHVQREFHEPNQGGLVQAPSGDWFFFTHHGDGAWEGRPASLIPVTWTDGWPVIGKVGPDGLGTMVWSARKPVQNGPLLVPQSDDDFSASRLSVQWEWNYQPRAGKWSLIERPGWLRLHAWKPLRPDDLKRAGNTLTQRVMRARGNMATAELDPSGMADGQVAGLCHYNRNYATIAVRREQGALVIETARNQTILRGPAINAKLLWLRSEWDLDGLCRFSYSTDGKTFASLGEPHPFGWADYRGERIGLFSYNNAGEAGHADFGSFTYRYDSALTR
ncbi:MAG: xynB 4 [Rariglobus sp.]|jgi:beta-xylosidase|nr:xynB 4 [Rariglobus sp.]